MDDVREEQFGQERGHDVGEEYKGFRKVGADQVERCGENNDIEDVVNEAYQGC